MSSAPTHQDGSNLVGRNELGTISVNPSVVGKIASRASIDIPEIGAAHTRMLGISVPGAALVGGRDTDLSALPKANAEVRGSTARVDLDVSVLWPHSVREVTERLRHQVTAEVQRICGLKVTEVRIAVPDFAMEPARQQKRVK